MYTIRKFKKLFYIVVFTAILWHKDDNECLNRDGEFPERCHWFDVRYISEIFNIQYKMCTTSNQSKTRRLGETLLINNRDRWILIKLDLDTHR